MRKITKHEEELMESISNLIDHWVDIEDMNDPRIQKNIFDTIDNWDLNENSKRYFESFLWNLFKAIRNYGKHKILEGHKGSAEFPDTQTDGYEVYN